MDPGWSGGYREGSQLTAQLEPVPGTYLLRSRVVSSKMETVCEYLDQA